MARRPLLRVDILSLFPGMFEGPLSESILKRARERGLLEVSVTDPRDFAEGRHRPVDDRPYGGGVGMVLMAEPLHLALARVRRRGALVVALTPAGRRFDQALARELSRRRRLVLVCGRYEGIDQRLLDRVDLELSIGDYVLTGGELPAMVVVDAVARLMPGVLAKEEAALRDSFSEPLLEHPHYTRPRVWRGKAVPAVLLSGDHRAIAEWRRRQAEARTRLRRPDLLRKML